MSDEIKFYGTHSLNESNGLPGSDMLGGYFNNTELSAGVLVPIYHNMLAIGMIDYCCLAAVNTTAAELTDVGFYFDIPASVTAQSAHQFGEAAEIHVDKAVSDTWNALGFILNETTQEIMFYQRVAHGAVNILYVELLHRGLQGTSTYNISVGDVLSFRNFVQCGIQAGSEVEIIATRMNSPLKVTFSNPVLASKLTLDSLAAYDWTAVWLRRYLPLITSVQVAADVTTAFDLKVDYT